jgi:mitochondrial inner membrane protease subunit 1
MPFFPRLRTSLRPALATAVAAAQLAAAAHVFMAYGFTARASWGPSMLPTFEVRGDWLLSSRRHRYGRGVRVGDLVNYTIPLEPENEGVKRVLGMPGDYVLSGRPGEDDGMIQVSGGGAGVVQRSLQSGGY